MTETKVLARIRGLLAKAEDPACTPQEAEALSAKATELIAKYAIDTALLEAQSEDRGKPTTRIFDVPNPYAKPKVTLLAGIARAHSARIVYHTSSGRATAVGYESDLALVELLYTSLLLQGTNAMLAAHQSSRSYRTSFWYGYAARVTQRLEEQKATAEQDAEQRSTGTALVLRDRRSEVEDAFRREFPRTRTMAAGRATSMAGWSGGTSAANRADLGSTRLGGGNAALGA